MLEADLTAGGARRRRRGGGSSTPLTLLLLAAVFVSALDFHPLGDAHDVVAGSAQLLYYPGASHPRAPHHAESGPPAQRQVCPACLVRLLTSGARLAPATQAPALALGERTPAPAVTSPVARARSPRGARAPPFA